MKRTLLLIVLLFLFPNIVRAESIANNKFGISLLQPSQGDIEKAAQLINSKGGKWGYVTLVIQENDRNVTKWQELFDELRRVHLIPIVRIATKPEGENWRRPDPQDAREWVKFLDSLNWVVKERYVVLFNEPNHANEWGGEVNPEHYAEVAVEFAEKLKEKNADFFVMLAGFDASAPSYPSTYEDEVIFLQKAIGKKPNLFDHIDGWSSHSYPNPAFSGSPWDTGRKSIRGYQWETEFLKELGVSKTFPVFITETGWVDERISRETVASYYETAFREVWGEDPRVVAVTPFVFSYQSAPFLGFSWKKSDGGEFYPQYYAVQRIEKEAGNPDIVEKGLVTQQLPHEFVASSNYHFTFQLKNIGQAIWDKNDGYELAFESETPVPFEYFFSDIKKLEPMRESEVSLFVKTRNVEGPHKAQITLKKNSETIANTEDWRFTIVPLPTLRLQVALYPKITSSGNDFEIQIYDEKEQLVYKKKGVHVMNGEGIVEDVQNVVLGAKYRIVLLKPYYIPRQTFVLFQKEKTTVRLKRMMPFDFNKDGAFNIKDAEAILRDLSLLKLFVP